MPMPEKIPCSVLVLTRNSAATLEKCLAPLSNFAEIVVHDANSEDHTVEIAKKFGGENSGKFINGVLGTLYKTLPPESLEEKTPPAAE
jgi:glycosyltransferase involved in cell wall biosynthesis